MEWKDIKKMDKWNILTLLAFMYFILIWIYTVFIVREVNPIYFQLKEQSILLWMIVFQLLRKK